MSETARPDAIAAYTVVVLQSGGHVLLLRRAMSKRFGPGRWTGLGGRVEQDELDRLTDAALRELAEESGIVESEVVDFTLRRVLLHARPGAPLTVLLYFTGRTAAPRPLASNEGELWWMPEIEIARLDVIDNTARVLPLLLADVARDRAGREPVRLGAACYDADGRLERIVWA